MERLRTFDGPRAKPEIQVRPAASLEDHTGAKSSGPVLLSRCVEGPVQITKLAWKEKSCPNGRLRMKDRHEASAPKNSTGS